MREHTFPLPEIESHKLDEVRDQLARPAAPQLVTMAKAYPWMTVALACVSGVLAGLWLKSRT
jgi:ElaB/YqjD/DUF883 family membrane-anchored ribosome-binding protein